MTGSIPPPGLTDAICHLFTRDAMIFFDFAALGTVDDMAWLLWWMARKRVGVVTIKGRIEATPPCR